MTDIIFDQADSEYSNGNFEKAFELFFKAAEDGNESAMDRIASIYESAEGVDYDYDKAIYWYQKAVDAGSITSLYNLGVSYRAKGDVSQAKYWFEKALDAGDLDAALELGKLHMICESEQDKVVFYLKKFLQSNNSFEDSRKEALDIISKIEK
ncbi:sel1 repeat family protein [Desulfonema ishimotonii]|uniref:Sel1 repeat family protein n=1 Tax=Desulfonema ishimotonii TaxID=45657 RepID=A0A401G0V8_9BACT|nr:tetratricopeptide repeat protein [Desulfonema ishimotonii]GBC62855.1 sel1 repeat family protein [Desulfonema ishimotonii]